MAGQWGYICRQNNLGLRLALSQGQKKQIRTIFDGTLIFKFIEMTHILKTIIPEICFNS